MKTISIIRLVCRLFLAALFLFAAGAKLHFRHQPGENFFTNVPALLEENFHVAQSWGIALAWSVLILELLVGALLLVPRTAKSAAAVGGAMLLGFAAFALYYRYGLGHEQGLECGCFGGLIKSQLGSGTAVRNLVLLLPALCIVWPNAPRLRLGGAGDTVSQCGMPSMYLRHESSTRQSLT